MSRFARWFLANQLRRVLVLAGFMVLPLTGLVSAALCALNGEINGWRVAVTDAALAVALLAGLILLGTAGIDLLLVAAVSWMICALMGSLAGRYGSMNLPAQLLVMGGCLLVAVIFVASGDPAETWRALLTQLYRETAELGLAMPGEDELQAAARIMTGLVAASSVATMILAVVLGGWLAARVNERPMGSSFPQLRMGYVLGVLAALAGVASIAGAGPIADNLLLVLVTGFVFQGLAVVHWQAQSRRWPQMWPLALYTPMLILPLSMLIFVALAAIGFTDNWYNLRRPHTDMFK